MKIHVGRDIERTLQRNGSALKALGDLRAMVAVGNTPPPARLKRSGSGRRGVFQPYVDLGLWHAKLDYSGRGHGDPLLVFQEDAAGNLHAVAVTRHELFTSVDHATCRSWLWNNRGCIEWQRSPACQAILKDLEAEFDRPRP